VHFAGKRPVEFLTGAQIAVCRRFDGGPARAELERLFFLHGSSSCTALRRVGYGERMCCCAAMTTRTAV
jgi:hypothetical protein